jgi:hypothetical protein
VATLHTCPAAHFRFPVLGPGPGSTWVSARAVLVGALRPVLVHSTSDSDAPSTDPGTPCPPGPPAAPHSGRTCTCGHSKQAHQHYRPGTDCAMCSCPRYTGPLSRLLPWRR